MRAAGVDCFDAGLFRISAAEAAAMDAQQRLLLEVCHEVIGAAAAPEPKPMVGSDQASWHVLSASVYQTDKA